MLRLSQKGWNNVIIFTMLAMILMLNISSFQSDDSHLPVPIIEEGGILLSLQIDQDVIERAGQTWRFSSSSPMASSIAFEGQSGALATLVNSWQRALVKSQNEVSAELLKSPDFVVVLWLAGERNGRVLPIKTIQQQTYLMLDNEVMLLDFPTVEQLTQW
ncbi:hypothetical protein [Brumicola pallidula]|jgi:hypothetical protein|uniref:DUF4340 domain-containing protein n=1 Tax=Brumicola pallidula DSM 14239 = ACAM 615 TaxID=1121922 RepID=K6Y298_9ALTE|nr:hypothetical protein [Glaciecola pallidula]GAC26949.1 hypothetical protein GPAL_0067 [Glaciecola pallidula DSM 14239 = ACAM 615]